MSTRPRVVSLVPSATETLHIWELDPIAVTRFCERPDLPSVGGTKDPDIDAVVALAPDLVVMCVEENRREDAEEFRRAGLELFIFDIDDVADVEPQLAALAGRVGVTRTSQNIAMTPAEPWQPPFVPIWRRPWMTLRGTTYGSSVFRALGVDNVFADHEKRYPEVTLDDVASHDVGVVLAPSEPYPFTERHREELESIAPVVFVDGKDLFWWGVRTPAAIDRLRSVLGVP